MCWFGNGWKYETSSTEAQKFGQIVLQALEVPLPCTCQHHLGSTILKQSDSMIFGREAHECVSKLLHSPKSGGRLVGPALALVRPLKLEEEELKEQQ